MQTKATAATYVRGKWVESTPTMSYHRNTLSQTSRSRYPYIKRMMREMGKAFAFLQLGKMSDADKIRTVVAMWWGMEGMPNGILDQSVVSDCGHSYRVKFEQADVAMSLVINDAEKFDAYQMQRRSVAMKVEDGVWIPAPWMSEGWFDRSQYSNTHYLHISEEDPLQVAYADSVDKFIADKYIRTKPGRYLTKFFGDVLTENQIREWTERMQAMAAPSELAFIGSGDKDGWERVYRDGPYSCMKGDDYVRVYAHDKSVLRLAYLVQGNNIMARCIVREDTKEYIRCYPNTDGNENNKWHMAMREAVVGAGYTHGDMEGVLLDADENSNGTYVCPYVDSGNGSYPSASLVHRDGSPYLLLSRDGEWDTQTQGGEIGDTCTCPNCGDSCDEDDLHYIESRGESICESCVDYNYTLAYVSRNYQEYVGDDEAILCESDGEHYWCDYASEASIYQCEVSGDYYHVDDLCQTSRGMVHTGRCVALDVDDADGNSYAYKDDVSETHDDRKIHEDDAETRADGLVYHKDDADVNQTELELETEGE